MTPRNKLAQGRIRTFSYAPYLASYIYALKQVESPGCGTCGVSKDGVLYWDPQFVEAQDPDTLAYVLIHEVLHLIFQHHARSSEAYGEHPDEQKRFAMNVAGDLVIEQTLKFMRPLRPAGAVHLGQERPEFGFKLDFAENLSMLDYYGQIMARLRERPKKRGDDGDGEGPGGDGDDKSNDGTARDSKTDKPKKQKKSGKAGASSKPNGQGAACNPSSGGSASDGVRREYEKPDETWQAFQEAVATKNLGDALARQEALQPGSVPGMLKEMVELQLHPQRDPFAHLKSVVASSTASPLGGRMQTYRRLSRKQPPDVCRLRGQLSTQATAVVIVDTSGSMGDRATKEKALQVIADGLKKLQRVKVVCADTHIRNSCMLKDVQNFEWEGGGGTDMARALREVDRDERPDSIVLITDAATDWPSRQTRAKVVVALTQESYYRQRIPRWCKTVPLY